MAKQITKTARVGLIVVAALNLVPNYLYSQPANPAQGQAPPAGGRAGRGGRGPADPNVNQFRTIDDVKYVDGEVQLPNSQPNPYQEAANWPELPAGRKLAAT